MDTDDPDEIEKENAPVKYAALVFYKELNGVNISLGRGHPSTIYRTYPGSIKAKSDLTGQAGQAQIDAD